MAKIISDIIIGFLKAIINIIQFATKSVSNAIIILALIFLILITIVITRNVLSK